MAIGIDKDQFKHVSYLWDDAKAASLGDDQVALLNLSFKSSWS